MKLYHLTTEAGEARILDRGFSDEDCTGDMQYDAEEDSCHNLEGVMFCEDDHDDEGTFWRELCEGRYLDGLKMKHRGKAFVAIDVPDDVIAQFKVSTGFGGNIYPDVGQVDPNLDHWIIPVAIANQFIVRDAGR